MGCVEDIIHVKVGMLTSNWLIDEKKQVSDICSRRGEISIKFFTKAFVSSIAPKSFWEWCFLVRMISVLVWAEGLQKCIKITLEILSMRLMHGVK